MTEVFNKPTVLSGSVTAIRSKRNNKTAAVNEMSVSTLQSEAKENAPVRRQPSEISDQRANLSHFATLSQTPDRRHVPRAVKRAKVLQRMEFVTATKEPVIAPQWLTISHYLRTYFLTRPVCVLTHSGRISGRLQEVTAEDIALEVADGPPRRLPFSAILSVGHL